MNQPGTSTPAESDSDGEPDSGPKLVSTATRYLRRGVRSGAVTGIIGGAGLLSGLRTFLRGQRGRGLVRLALGGAFVAAALAQRRSRRESREVTDVIDIGSDVETIADDAGDADEEDHATGQAAAEVADTTSDLPSDETAVGDDTDSSDGPRIEKIDRLGEAAMDGQSREVPVPQRAFNQGFLAHSAEVFWGIRGRDDAVLVSRDFDAVQGPDGVEYVASSEIDDDVRELPLPTAVLNHWDEVGDSTAVTGGDDVLFVTTDGLEADHLLRVLPSGRADDLTE